MKPVIIITIAFVLSIIGFNSMNFPSAYQSSEPTPEIILQIIPEPTPELIPEPTPELIPEPISEPAPKLIPELTPEPSPEPTPEIIPEPTPELIPESPQESEKSSNGEAIIISDEDKSTNNQIIWVFVIISFIIMGFAILKKKISSSEGGLDKR